MNQNILIRLGDKKINIPVKKTNSLSKIYGLMFRTRNTNNLLFEFNKLVDISFTSLFVFFPYLSIWLDEKNNVIDYRIISPFTAFVKIKKLYKRVIEVPINDKNKEILAFFRREREKV